MIAEIEMLPTLENIARLRVLRPEQLGLFMEALHKEETEGVDPNRVIRQTAFNLWKEVAAQIDGAGVVAPASAPAPSPSAPAPVAAPLPAPVLNPDTLHRVLSSELATHMDGMTLYNYQALVDTITDKVIARMEGRDAEEPPTPPEREQAMAREHPRLDDPPEDDPPDFSLDIPNVPTGRVVEVLDALRGHDPATDLFPDGR